MLENSFSFPIPHCSRLTCQPFKNPISKYPRTIDVDGRGWPALSALIGYPTSPRCDQDAGPGPA